MSHTSSPHRSLTRVTASAGIVGLILAGCTAVIPTTAGPHATEPICADIILAIPKDLAGLKQVRTSSQSAAAWEDPTGSGLTITARCGVEVPEPTVDPCVGIGEIAGEEIDWVQQHDEAQSRWTFVTYGRYPAVEIVINGTASQPTVPLIEAAAAMRLAEQFASCY